MKQILTSWFFFTALLLCLLAASWALPDLMDQFFGSTEQHLNQVAAYVEAEAQAVWAQLLP